MSSTLNLSLTDELRAFIDRNSGDGTLYATPSEFVRDVLREKIERMEAAQVRDAILEGYQDAISGRTVAYAGNLRDLLRKARLSRRRRNDKAALVLTERAISDLREVERYSTARWGSKATDKYLDDLAAALDRISENPDLLRREPGLATGLYFYRVRKHVLVCDYRDRAVVVLAIVHTAMDLAARLAELEPRLSAEAGILHEKLHRGPPSG